MSIKKEQVRELIESVLFELGLNTPEAIELLMLTSAQESHLGTYIRQLGTGPALGIFQMEPNTEADIWNNYLRYKKELRGKVLEFKSQRHDDLYWNLGYQVCMCRVHYLRQPGALPNATDINGLAAYWKKYYNTYLGKGTVAEAIHNYYKYCG